MLLRSSTFPERSHIRTYLWWVQQVGTSQSRTRRLVSQTKAHVCFLQELNDSAAFIAPNRVRRGEDTWPISHSVLIFPTYPISEKCWNISTRSVASDSNDVAQYFEGTAVDWWAWWGSGGMYKLNCQENPILKNDRT